MGFVARIAASLSSNLKSMVAFQLPISLFWDAVQKSNRVLQGSTMHKCNCPLCSTAVSGDPSTIWKYNALYHLISEHSSGSTPPSIPGQLLVQIFIIKEEEKALGISEHNTVDWRRQNNIPDSDVFELGKTRKRSDTKGVAD